MNAPRVRLLTSFEIASLSAKREYQRCQKQFVYEK